MENEIEKLLHKILQSSTNYKLHSTHNHNFTIHQYVEYYFGPLIIHSFCSHLIFHIFVQACSWPLGESIIEVSGLFSKFLVLFFMEKFVVLVQDMDWFLLVDIDIEVAWWPWQVLQRARLFLIHRRYLKCKKLFMHIYKIPYWINN